jgi:hypothetical protein
MMLGRQNNQQSVRELPITSGDIVLINFGTLADRIKEYGLAGLINSTPTQIGIVISVCTISVIAIFKGNKVHLVPPEDVDIHSVYRAPEFQSSTTQALFDSSVYSMHINMSKAMRGMINDIVSKKKVNISTAFVRVAMAVNQISADIADLRPSFLYNEEYRYLNKVRI